MTSPVKSRCVMGTGVGDGATAIVDVVDGASIVAGSALELLEHAADASTIAAIVQVSSVTRICAQLYTNEGSAAGSYWGVTGYTPAWVCRPLTQRFQAKTGNIA